MSQHSPSGSTPEPTPEPLFSPDEAYKVFLSRLVQARLDRGYNQAQLAQHLGLTSAEVAAYEAGVVALNVIDVRAWLAALQVPLVPFTEALDEELDRTLDRDAVVRAPQGQGKTVTSLPSQAAEETPTIEVLVLAPNAAPALRTIPQTLGTMQQTVGGLIEIFETGLPQIVGVAHEEALLENAPLNFIVPATGAHIFGTVFFAGEGSNGDLIGLTPLQIEQMLEAFCPTLGPQAYEVLIRTHPDGPAWIESWE